jgi:hypothetical protein
LTTAAGILVLFAAFASSGCSVGGNEGNECDETKQDLIEPLFRIHFVATTEQGDPYTGAMSFQSEKHYCDGTVKGVFTDHTDGTANGYWKPITTQYKLANDEDFVLIILSTPTSEGSFTYYYDTVANAMVLEDYVMWVFEDTVEVVVELMPALHPTGSPSRTGPAAS